MSGSRLQQAGNRRQQAKRFARRTGVAIVLATLLPAAAGASPLAPAQSVGTLRERAAAVAAELTALDERTNALDEKFNAANLELEQLAAERDANQQLVDAAVSSLSSTRGQAQRIAIEAYVGNNDNPSLPGISDDAAEESRRRTFLSARYGDSEQVIEGLVASQQDLADREAALKASAESVDAKVAEINDAKGSLESIIADRKALAASVNSDLEAAVKAEQERLAAEAAAKAEADARAAAARAVAAQRPQAVAVRTPVATAAGVASPTTVPAATPAAPAVRSLTPPPAGSPTAVQVAMDQRGDPYRWAGAGPDSFDCSGLIMFAYKAAGVSLPHSSRALRSMTRSITVDELQPGDLVFGGSPIHHVGLYIGNGEMVHAPHSGDVVKVSGIYSTSKPVSFGRL